MSRDIPFFEMFTELQLSGELRLRLAGAVVNGACIDQAGMSLALRLTTRAELGDAELEELKHLLMGVYGFRQVTTEVTCKAPSSQAAAAGSTRLLRSRRPPPAVRARSRPQARS